MLAMFYCLYRAVLKTTSVRTHLSKDYYYYYYYHFYYYYYYYCYAVDQ